jgi:Raf kinase inhibitor-like YbhB/YbcL family protein
MRLTSDSITDGEPIPGHNAFCVPDPEGGHVTFAANVNPDMAWLDVPEGTQSFVITCIDPDVPSAGDDVNQEDREVPADLPRVEFVHWLLADLPADIHHIAAGEYSDGVTPRGKPGRTGRPVEGVNDYTGWFAGDADMGGVYKGFDGPCPPWNDSIVHRYVFTVHALDVAEVGVSGDFTLAELREAMDGHVLDSVSITCTYTLNPRLR